MDRWPELGRASISVGRMVANVNQLRQFLLESEAILSQAARRFRLGWAAAAWLSWES